MMRSSKESRIRMLTTISRKLRQVAADPVLRRYLAGRALGRWPSLGTPVIGPVPGMGSWPARAEAGHRAWLELQDGCSGGFLPLPGLSVRAAPDLFDHTFADGEALSALHRFAWLPLQGTDACFRNVQMLWAAWRARFAAPDDSPAWEAYTAAERVINMLDLGRRAGLPAPLQDTVAVLAAHAPAIAERLEYFGEHATCNHLFNNARGLYRLGCDLGMPDWADWAASLLRREAERLFLPSGVLREGSSHYHLLYVRNAADCWLAARRAGRADEAREWQELTARLMAVLPHLALPGGLPLVGDVSPDSPPVFLAGLLPGGAPMAGWTGLLPANERDAVIALRDRIAPADTRLLTTDGWLRVDARGWSGLWYAAPEGWCFSPGHGHQDVGACEIHFGSVPLFIDPGRGAYGEEGDAALFRSAEAHGGLQVEGADPYPANKPYYPPEFRRAVGGRPPRLEAGEDRVHLAFEGFTRLDGVGQVTRQWCFAAGRLEIEDKVAGRGRRRITRRLVTPHPVRRDGSAAIIETSAGHFAVSSSTGLEIVASKRWVAYGQPEPAWAIWWDADADLPWNGRITVEKL